METRVRSRPTRVLGVILAVALSAVSFVGFSQRPAAAWAWDPHVTLQGKIGCTYSTGNTVRWAWVEGSNGERGWARLGSGGMTRPYAFDFWRVPTSTMTVTVTWGCSIDGQHRTSFGLNRPTSGTSATRHICYWWPCYL